MNLAGRRLLVTGASGFIGSHLVERLVAAGARTRALVRYNSAGSWGWLDESPAREDVEVVAGDVTDRDSLREAVRGAEVIFHLAALIAIPYSYRAPSSYQRTNAEGTLNLLQAAIEAGCGLVVHTSTSEVYGTARYVPIDEDHPLQGQSPYSASKIGADKIAEAFHLSYGLPVVTVRPFNTYGPRQSARAVIPTVIVQALKEPVVRLGNTEPTRDFTFVSDTAEGFIRAAQTAAAVGQVVNLGSGHEISVNDLARIIVAAVGREVRIERDDARARPAGSEVHRLCADTRRAATLLGWQARCPLAEGLQQTVTWLERNLDRYRPRLYAV